MQTPQTSSIPHNKTCPFLGLRDDRDSFLGNPSPGNYCYHCKTPTSPLILHQESYCLSLAYDNCPVFQAEEQLPFPESLHDTEAALEIHRDTIRNSIYSIIALGLLVVVAFFFLRNSTRQSSPALGSSQNNSPETAIPSALPVTSTSLSTPIEPSPSAIPSSVPSATATLTPTSLPLQRHALEAPVKVNGQDFIIHLAMDGEGFDYLAKTYDTTVEVIQGINYALPPAIWVNLAIVVAPGARKIDPTWPLLQAYKVTEPKINLTDAAKALQVDTGLLKLFTACQDDCVFSKGDWIIVPHPRNK